MFYVDKLKNDIWAIELSNDYTLKNIGKFPNVSSLAYVNGQLFLASRTKSRIAVVDYSTLGLVAEFTTVSKPISMKVYNSDLYVLGAQNNQLQRIDTNARKVLHTIDLGPEGFSVGFNKIDGTSLAIITDVKFNKYSVIDLANGNLLNTYSLNVPINDIKIANKVRLFD